MEKLEDRLTKAKNIVLSVLGDNVISVVLYGSVGRGDYVEGVSDINMLVLVKDNSVQLLKNFWKYHRRLRKLRLSLVILTRDYITSSLDSFPLEFLDMKTSGRTIFGAPIDSILDIPRDSLRLQCERELKGKSLLLRSVYLNSKGSEGVLKSAIIKSYNSLKTIGRGLLYLKGNATKGGDILVRVAEDYGLDAEIFKKAREIREKRLNLKGQELQGFFESYVREIERLQVAIDKFGTGL